MIRSAMPKGKATPGRAQDLPRQPGGLTGKLTPTHPRKQTEAQKKPGAQGKLWAQYDKLHARRAGLNGPGPGGAAPARLKPYITSIINHKGGTGKTTTTINLGTALAYLGFSTLLVDLDPQRHTTIVLGIESDAFVESMAEVMSTPGKAVDDITLLTYIPNLYLAPGHIHLAPVAEQIYARIFREAILFQALQTLSYDFILIDCPPSLGVLTINCCCPVEIT